MSIPFPADLTQRPATSGDLQAITKLVCACELADTGRCETLQADIEDMWEDTNLARDSFVLVTAEGQLVGYTAVHPSREYIVLDPHTCVHPAQRPRGLMHALLALAAEHARQFLLAAEPPIPAWLRAWAFSTPSHLSQLRMFEQEGYHVTTSEINLEIALEREPEVPYTLQGITTRRYLPGQDERAVYTVIQESFQDIGDHPYRTFEEWSERATGHSHFDPQQLLVAQAGEQIVGAILCRTYEMQASEGEAEGHIAQLGVLRPWRRLGIARHLIQQVFLAYYQRDIQYVTISVDAHNSTGARQLYQAMGMREYEQVYNLLKPL